jgi:uncharacterized phage protein (TIGR02216 family)
MSAMDWAGLLRVGLHGLRLTPDQFWCLTPVELRTMLGAENATAPLTRTRLAELSRAFPDKKKETEIG